jgi:biopolymer transport protein ExbD
LPKNHAHNVKQNSIQVISLIDSHFVVGIVFEIVAAFSTISCGVVYPNLRHVPTKVLAEEIKTLRNKHSEAHEEDLKFSASARSQYEARLLAHAVDLSVESKRKNEEDKSKNLSNEGLVQVIQSQGHTREVKRDLS